MSELIEFDDRKQVFANNWQSFQRRTLEEYWQLGNELDAIISEMRHGERGPWLDSIGLDPSYARKMRRVGREFEIGKLSRFGGISDAIKALPRIKPPKEPKEEPKTVPQGNVIYAWEDAEAEAEDAASIEEVFKEEMEQSVTQTYEPRFDADRERIMAERHSKDVADFNAARKSTQREQRKNRDICDALLSIPRGQGDQGIDDTLAKFFNVARK